MISKIWNGVRGKVANVAAVVAVAAVVMFLNSQVLLAQGDGPASVTFNPIVNFGDLFTSLTTTIGPIVVGALMLGLAIWGARYIFGVIKSMGR